MHSSGQVPARGAQLDPLVRTAFCECDAPGAIRRLKDDLGPGPFALVILYAAPRTNLTDLLYYAGAAWPGAIVTGCTTAGEIVPDAGYVDDGLLAVCFPKAHFAAKSMVIRSLADIDPQALISETIRARAELSTAAPSFDNEFACLLVDGLSLAEDRLASTLAAGLGPMAMFGGSAGDGTNFESAPIFWQGEVLHDAAVLTMLRSKCEAHVFSLNHFHPTEQRMVVTRADPSNRIVYEINAEPAAQELGRILGRAPEQIDTFTFAQNPVVVRIGTEHHVRAIKRVTETGALEFFSAIDEGLVLTIAQAEPMVDHLQTELGALCAQRQPDVIIAHDCLLRRIEAEQKQVSRGVSSVLAKFRVAGFSTYGEQIGGMHVNQTMTGVALYAPSR